MTNATETTETPVRMPSAAAPAPLKKITLLLRSLDRAGVRYCHWKSNYGIRQALAGKGDLDLLVEKEDFPAFVTALLQQGFKQAESATSRRQPGVFHFLGNDDAKHGIVNVHAYARILTGDHFLKTWAIPLERMLLTDTRWEYGICLPSKAAELVVFVFRSMIKHTTLLDIYLGQHSRKAVMEEYRWLVSDSHLEDCYRKLAVYFPMISRSDFRTALKLTGTDTALLKRVRMGLRFQRALSRYRRYGRLRQMVWTATALGNMVLAKALRSRKAMTLRGGGAIIAVVGPHPATRAALADRIHRWLGRQLAVGAIHPGEPPSTWFSCLPRACMAAIRRLAPGRFTRRVDRGTTPRDEFRLTYLDLVRQLVVAYERAVLLRRAYRDSRNGQIIVCDHYPQPPEAVDGAVPRPNSFLKRGLLRWKARLDRSVCPPDLILQLGAGAEGEAESNHVQKNPSHDTMRDHRAFSGCPVISLSNDGELEEIVLEARQLIWEHL